MFKFIKKIFKFFTKSKDFSDDITRAYLEGVREERMRNYQDRFNSKYIEIEVFIGKPFFSIGNEWEDPIIGIVIGVEHNEKHMTPYAVIWDYVKNEKSLCFNTVRSYSQENFDALYKLNPFERWNLMCNTTKHSSIGPENRPPLLTKEEMINKLKLNGFFDKIKQ